MGTMNGEIIDRRANGSEMSAPMMEEAVVHAGAAMQRVQTSYATAISVQKPRNLQHVVKKLLEEANMAGPSFFYGWGAGNDKIEGASVDLARSAVRCWGNCAIEMLPVQETPTAWIFTAHFVDLESGVTIPRQFRQSKSWKVFGKHDDARKEDIRFQIGQSKAIRNVILFALPGWMIDQAIEQAKDGVRQKIEEYVNKNGIAAAIDAVLKALTKVGVAEDRVLHKMGLADRKALNVDHIILLKGDHAAIESGQVFADEVFPAIKPAEPSTLTDKIKGGTPAKEEKPKPSAEEKEAPSDPEAEAPENFVSPESLSTFEAFEKSFLESAPIDIDAPAEVLKKTILSYPVKDQKKGGLEARKLILMAIKANKFNWETGKAE